MPRKQRGAPMKTAPKKKTTRKKKPAPKGLGDTIEKAIQVTGVDKVVKVFANGRDCGCDKRKEALNKMFPYKKINCLTEDLYLKWKRHRPKIKSYIRPEEQQVIMEVYNHLFGIRQKPCAGCVNSGTTWMRLVKEIDKVYDLYEKDIKAEEAQTE